MMIATIVLAIAIAPSTPSPSPTPTITPPPTRGVAGPRIPVGAPKAGTLIAPGVAFAAMREAEGFEHRAHLAPRRSHGIFAHLVPGDPTERKWFEARVFSQLVDGLVTAVGLRGSHVRYPDLASFGQVPATTTSATLPWWNGTSRTFTFYTPASAVLPSNYVGLSATLGMEIDPLVAPSAHGGLPTLLLGGLAWDIFSARHERAWTSRQRTTADVAETTSHVAGIATWLPIIARERSISRAYWSCAQVVHPGDLTVPAPTSTVAPTLVAPGQCQGFTSATVTSK